MHGEEVDLSRVQNPTVVVAYLLVAGVLYGCHRFAVVGAPAVEAEAHGAPAIGEGGQGEGALATAK
jgi:hypothetical protein